MKILRTASLRSNFIGTYKKSVILFPLKFYFKFTLDENGSPLGFVFSKIMRYHLIKIPKIILLIYMQ